MVFHYRCCRGHVFAQSFFFYHFLPVFVFLVATGIKVVLQLAFDLQDDIDQPLIPMLVDSSSCQSLYQLFWSLAFGVTEATSDMVGVESSFAFAASSFGVRCLSDFVHAVSEAGVDLISLVSKLAVFLLVCVTVVITSTVFVRFLFDSLPSAYPKDNHSKMRKNFKEVVRLFQQARRIGFLRHLRPRTINNVYRLLYAITAIVPLIALRFVYMRFDCNVCFEPRAVQNLHKPDAFWTSYHQQADNSSVLPPLSSVDPLLQEEAVCARESDLESICELAFRGTLIWIMVVLQWTVVAVSVYTRPHVYRYLQKDKREKQSKEAHGSLDQDGVNGLPVTVEVEDALNHLEDVLIDDVNWHFVVVDACFAGMLIAAVYVVVLVVTSKGGFMYGLSVFLTVSSGQSAFYGIIWFGLHWIATLSASLTYIMRIIHASYRRSLAWATALSCIGVSLWTHRLYNNFLVCILVLFCLFTILPVVTLAMYMVWPLADEQAQSRSKSGGKSGKTIPAPPDPLSPFAPVDADEDEVPSSPQRNGSGAVDTPDGSRVRFRSIAQDAAVSEKGRGKGATSKKACGWFRQLLVGLLRRGTEASVERAYSGKRPVRYKVYCGIGFLISAVLLVVLLAVVERFFVSSDVLPDNWSVTKTMLPVLNGKDGPSVGLSVTLDLRNITFASGHLLVHPQSPTKNNTPTVGQYGLNTGTYCALIQGLTMADYCWMTQLAYLTPGTEDFNAFLEVMFPDFVLRKAFRAGIAEPSDTTDPLRRHRSTSRAVFYDLYSAKRNLSVITVRGTTAYEMSDWLADVEVWVEAATFQLFSKFLPGLSWWPSTLVSQVIRIIDLVVDAFIPQANPIQAQMRHYYFPVLEYTQTIQDREVVLCGHSMGGGVAKIVGARLNHRAISVSGPGIKDSRGKLRVTEEAINRNAVNIVPSSDLVARIGRQGGTILNVVCSDESPWFCHFPMNTACHLMTRCGHPVHDMECVFERAYFAPWALRLFYSALSSVRRTLLS